MEINELMEMYSMGFVLGIGFMSTSYILRLVYMSARKFFI